MKDLKERHAEDLLITLLNVDKMLIKEGLNPMTDTYFNFLGIDLNKNKQFFDYLMIEEMCLRDGIDPNLEKRWYVDKANKERRNSNGEER